MPQTTYSIPDFIADAKKLLASPDTLAMKKAAIGELLRELAKREDLLRFGRPIGHADASNFNWILHREAPDRQGRFARGEGQLKNRHARSP